MAAGLGWGIAAALAGAGGAQWAGSQPDPLRGVAVHDFAWAHGRDEVLQLTEDRYREFPTFADFDMLATFELAEGAELDIVVRKVEPRLRTTDAGTMVSEPFHGRFHVVRLSTRAAGPPYRSREQALFGDQPGGAKLAPGRPATVRVEARGHRLRANVAGQAFPWHKTVDDHGGIALVARGGPVLMRDFKIDALERRATPPWTWGAALGAALSLVLWLASPRRAPLRLAAASLSLLAGGLLAARLVFDHLLPDATADPEALLLGTAALVPAGLGLAARRRRLAWALAGCALGAGMLEGAARLQQDRLAAFEDPRLDLYFGPDSGGAPFDALARRVRNRGPHVHTLDLPETTIAFLGGAMVFEASEDLAEQAGLRATLALQQRLGRRVEGVVFPTVFSNTLQQLLLLRRFYLDYRPRVVVFAVTRFEAMPSAAQSTRARWQQVRDGQLPPRSWSALWQLHRPRGRDAPASTAADLEATLAELAALGRERGFALVLVIDPELAPALQGVVERFAATHDAPVVRDVVDAAGHPRVEPLVEAIAQQLERGPR